MTIAEIAEFYGVSVKTAYKRAGIGYAKKLRAELAIKRAIEILSCSEHPISIWTLATVVKLRKDKKQLWAFVQEVVRRRPDLADAIETAGDRRSEKRALSPRPSQEAKTTLSAR